MTCGLLVDEHTRSADVREACTLDTIRPVSPSGHSRRWRRIFHGRQNHTSQIECHSRPTGSCIYSAESRTSNLRLTKRSLATQHDSNFTVSSSLLLDGERQLSQQQKPWSAHKWNMFCKHFYVICLYVYSLNNIFTVI